MLLPQFLRAFIDALESCGIDHCVLRNYEGLPNVNFGNDIDFLIDPVSVNSAVKIICNIEGVEVTGYIKRPYVISIFLHGVSWGDGKKSIQIDFFTTLSWKGLPYISVTEVFRASKDIQSSKRLIKKPNDVHEAINSFFCSYLVGGWIKDKYQSNVRNIFSSNREHVFKILRLFLSENKTNALIDTVIADDRDRLMALLSSVKRGLFMERFLCHPFETMKVIFIYYFYEVKIRFTHHPIDNVCFLGCDGAGKSAIIGGLLHKLKGATKQISIVHLKPKLRRHNVAASIPVADPHGMKKRGTTLSAAKLVLWCVLYWKDYFFHGHKNLTLRIWDRYYYDVYIDPKRYRYGAPLWLARLIGKFVPKPGLIIILDASAEIIYARKQEVSLEEIKRQREAYLLFAKETPNAIVLNTDQPLKETVNDATQEVLKYMVKRQKVRLGGIK